MERINLVNESSYQNVYGDLSGRLNEWMRETNDPLLSGRILKPEGAIANKATALNFEDEFEYSMETV